MHDVRLILFTRPDCQPCVEFHDTVVAAIRAASCQGRSVAAETVSLADDPERVAAADVHVFPTLVGKVNGIPVGRLEAAADRSTVDAFIDAVELADVI